MQPILVAYGTTEGQTRKIAEFMAERLRIRGHRVDLVDTASPKAEQVLPIYQGAMLGGSVHQGRHQTSLMHFLKANRDWLGGMPVGLYSVSLAAALDDMDSRLEARRMLDELVDDSGLKPVAQRCIGGALRYTRYDYFKRIFMRMVAGQRGQATDASKDVEYSDWPDVEAFVDEFLVAAGISLAATASPS